MKIGKSNQGVERSNKDHGEIDNSQLLRVMKRINSQRKDLEERISELDEKIIKISTGKQAVSNTFNAEDLLKEAPILSTLVQQRQVLSEATALPNYADAEFRKLSIPYIEALAEEMTEKAISIGEQIEDDQVEISTLEERITKNRDELRIMSGEWAQALVSIGISDRNLYSDFAVGSYTRFADEYKKLCAKYE